MNFLSGQSPRPGAVEVRNSDETSLQYPPTMADAIRRSHARIPCDRPVEVHHGATGRLIGGARMLNLSLSGALLAIAGELQRGVPYRIRLDRAVAGDARVGAADRVGHGRRIL